MGQQCSGNRHIVRAGDLVSSGASAAADATVTAAEWSWDQTVNFKHRREQEYQQYMEQQEKDNIYAGHRIEATPPPPLPPIPPHLHLQPGFDTTLAARKLRRQHANEELPPLPPDAQQDDAYGVGGGGGGDMRAVPYPAPAVGALRWQPQFSRQVRALMGEQEAPGAQQRRDQAKDRKKKEKEERKKKRQEEEHIHLPPMPAPSSTTSSDPDSRAVVDAPSPSLFRQASAAAHSRNSAGTSVASGPPSPANSTSSSAERAAELAREQAIADERRRALESLRSRAHDKHDDDEHKFAQTQQEGVVASSPSPTTVRLTRVIEPVSERDDEDDVDDDAAHMPLPPPAQPLSSSASASAAAEPIRLTRVIENNTQQQEDEASQITISNDSSTSSSSSSSDPAKKLRERQLRPPSDSYPLSVAADEPSAQQLPLPPSPHTSARAQQHELVPGETEGSSHEGVSDEADTSRADGGVMDEDELDDEAVLKRQWELLQSENARLQDQLKAQQEKQKQSLLEKQQARMEEERRLIEEEEREAEERERQRSERERMLKAQLGR